MKKQLFNKIILCCILCIPFFSCSSRTLVQDSSFVSKSISYKVDTTESAYLNVTTSFSNVNIIEWDKSEVCIDIKITGYGSSKEKAIKNAQRVTTDWSSNNNTVNLTVSLDIPDKKIEVSGDDKEFEIEVTLRVPRKIYMNIHNEFGNVVMQNTALNFTGDISFGSLKMNQLFGEVNKIKVKYGTLRLGQAQHLTLNASFSEIKADQLGKTDIDSKYNTVKFHDATDVKLSSSYDNVSMENVSDINLNCQYSTICINQLQTSFLANQFTFNDLTIKSVSPQFKEITINGSFSDIKIPIDNKYSYKAHYKTSYGNLKYKLDTVTEDKSADDLDKIDISGYNGNNPSPDAKIEIDNNYGNINMK